VGGVWCWPCDRGWGVKKKGAVKKVGRGWGEGNEGDVWGRRC